MNVFRVKCSRCYLILPWQRWRNPCVKQNLEVFTYKTKQTILSLFSQSYQFSVIQPKIQTVLVLIILDLLHQEVKKYQINCINKSVLVNFLGCKNLGTFDCYLGSSNWIKWSSPVIWLLKTGVDWSYWRNMIPHETKAWEHFIMRGYWLERSQQFQHINVHYKYKLKTKRVGGEWYSSQQ